MFQQLLIISAIIIVMTQAKYLPAQNEEHKYEEEQEDYYAPAKYKYSYGVEDHKTGDYKSHKEESDGEIVKGEYTVADPDGTIRTVRYTVGKHTGFQAVVTTHKGDDDYHEEYYGFPADYHKPESYVQKPIYDYSNKAVSSKKEPIVPSRYTSNKYNNYNDN